MGVAEAVERGFAAGEKPGRLYRGGKAVAPALRGLLLARKSKGGISVNSVCAEPGLWEDHCVFGKWNDPQCYWGP